MAREFMRGLTRREMLSASLLTGGVWLVGADRLLMRQRGAVAQQDAFAGGKRLGVVDFVGESRVPVPMETPLGSELDGRQFTDLSALAAEQSSVSTEKFYVRTRASKLLDLTKPWKIQMPGEGPAAALTMAELARISAPLGLHLMECAGNTREGHFGLLSVADWTGVPLAKLADRIAPKEKGTRVSISGFDTYSGASRTSLPGASWVFTWDELMAAGAFLALKMNGAALTVDHGAPVRMVLPGWYGCTCIKWLNEISIVSDDVAATSQMQEFAQRTHQQGIPQLARDFEPARIDPAAMPIRVEKWQLKDGIKYKIIGISWGGPERAKSLAIQFNAGEEFVAVDHLDAAKTDSWSFWNHAWSPARPGTYIIRLRVTEPQVRTRRLDMGFYARAVQIDEV